MSETETPSDINELFSRDPMKLTDRDIDKIILEFRKRRNIFNASPATAAGKTVEKKLTAKEQVASSIKIDFKL